MLVQLPSSAEIRQVRQYSNILYIVASHVVTTLSGMPFTDFVTTRIFDRLGMKDTTFDITRATQSGKRVYSFVRTGVGERKAENAWNTYKSSEDSDIPLDCLGNPTCYEWAPGFDIVHHAGAGGIWTTAADMVCRDFGFRSFVNVGLDALAARTSNFIPPAVFSVLAPARSIPFAAPGNAETGLFTYSLGTYVHPCRGHKVLYHASHINSLYRSGSSACLSYRTTTTTRQE
jgi:CubicO group peptidase (beta-lactamase class C family)